MGIASLTTLSNKIMFASAVTCLQLVKDSLLFVVLLIVDSGTRHTHHHRLHDDCWLARELSSWHLLSIVYGCVRLVVARESVQAAWYFETNLERSYSPSSENLQALGGPESTCSGRSAAYRTAAEFQSVAVPTIWRRLCKHLLVLVLLLRLQAVRLSSSAYNKDQTDPPMRKHCFQYYTIRITNKSPDTTIQIETK